MSLSLVLFLIEAIYALFYTHKTVFATWYNNLYKSNLYFHINYKYGFNVFIFNLSFNFYKLLKNYLNFMDRLIVDTFSFWFKIIIYNLNFFIILHILFIIYNIFYLIYLNTSNVLYLYIFLLNISLIYTELLLYIYIYINYNKFDNYLLKKITSLSSIF